MKKMKRYVMDYGNLTIWYWTMKRIIFRNEKNEMDILSIDNMEGNVFYLVL